MEFFNKNEFDAFRNNKGKDLTEVSEIDKGLIAEIHKKSVHLANLIKDKLNAVEVINAKHTINPSRKSSLKRYLWYRIVPNENWQNLGLAFTFTFDDKFWLRVDSDKWDDAFFKRKALLKFRDDNNIDKSWEFEELLNNENYELLADEAVIFYKQIIEEHKQTLNDIATIKVGLLASDSTDWKNYHIEKGKSFNYFCLWNSKRPSGTTKTIKELKETIERFGFFDFYYFEGDSAQYKAEIIGIAQKDRDLEEWKTQYGSASIYGFTPKVSDFKDDSKKAKIVFLARSFQKLNAPIPKSKFNLYGNFSYPRQDNLSPFFMNNTMDLMTENTPVQSPNFNEINPPKDLGIPKNQILFGPPGTGKTYHTINKALAIVDPTFKTDDRKILKNKFDEYVNSGQIVFTTFHQSMSYEDFVEGIKPETEKGKVTYEVQDGIFKQICQAAETPNQNDFNIAYNRLSEALSKLEDEKLELKTPTDKRFWIALNSNDNLNLYTKTDDNKQGSLTKEKLQQQINGEKVFRGWEGYFQGVIDYLKSEYNYSEKAKKSENFVLIIDEINRGNVSSIFGELITLLEEDKRLGKEEALKVKLPYSKTKFGVPQNLYIIGTMNTADRSVEALDSALRRRFSFTEMPPKPKVIKKNEFLENGKLDEIDLVDILTTINKRIEILLDKDHLIGHSYFMQVADLEDLKKAFAEKVIPLLQEYFYGDYGKIALILGEGFCKGKEQEKVENLFAKVDNYDVDSYSDKVIYEISDVLSEDFEIEKAINLLLNKAV